MNDNEKYLLVCSIGPVQDFIATARTSHDLWFGSWMLSELSKAGARAIAGTSHPLIFPAHEKIEDLEPGSTLSVANKIVAIVHGDPAAVAGRLAQSVRDHLEQIYDSTVGQIKDGIDQELAREQVMDLVELNWSSVPYHDEASYPAARARAEALLAARKSTRNFRQWQGRPGYHKSSLDGIRESVLLPGADVDSQVRNLAAPGEELSGVDLLKRCRGSDGAPAFRSTTDLAAAPFLLWLGEERKQALLRSIKGLLQEYNTRRTETEGAHFYEERLAQLIEDEDRRKEFRERLAGILPEGKAPSPYYALLRADGDNMGRAIAAQRTPAAHRALSLRISAFASEARQTVLGHDGMPVYMGGDDLLAILPLHTALQCVARLDEEFRTHMAGMSLEGGPGATAPSLSFGLVIAHHLTPLSDVLDLAGRAEREAKEIEGKNGLAIVLSKRSGTERTISGKVRPLRERMELLVKAVGQVSKGTPYELENLDRQLRLAGLGSETEAAQQEAKRIIERKRESGGDSPAVAEVQEQLVDWLAEGATTLPQLAYEMIVAGEFARARSTAGAAFFPATKEVQP